MENQISAFGYKQYALEVERDTNFIVGVERIKKGCTVLTNKSNDLNVTLIVLEHAQLGDGVIGGCFSRKNNISKVTEQEKTGLAEGNKSLI